jgi:hypothetical protein
MRIALLLSLLSLALTMAAPAASPISPSKSGAAFDLGDYTWKEMHEDMERDHFAGTYGGQSQAPVRTDERVDC